MVRTAILALVIGGGLLSGCSMVAHKPLGPPDPIAKGRQIAIFFDGTSNNEASDTNVKRLHSLVTLQRGKNLATLYVEGVGTSTDILGAGTGWGMSARVQVAYEFLLNHYRPGMDDKVYLFGFSRGAFAARILASVLQNAGLPRRDGQPNRWIASKVYDAVKGDHAGALPEHDQACITDKIESLGLTRRRADVQCFLARQYHLAGFEPVPVEVLGLWDTVEAMGLPDWPARMMHKLRPFRINVDDANPLYGDQLCNVVQAFHAMSIDDNREWIFTPLLLTRQHQLDNCERLRTTPGQPDARRLKAVVEEVWFSGAHSDVGGGYGDSLLSGVSLNWMIDRLQPSKLLPDGAGVPEDPFGSSHDPEAETLGGQPYIAMTRNIGAWLTDARQRTEYLNTMWVHPSVFKRRRAIPLRPHENSQLLLLGPGSVCLVEDKTLEDRADPQRLVEANAKDGKLPTTCNAVLQVKEWSAAATEAAR